MVLSVSVLASRDRGLPRANCVRAHFFLYTRPDSKCIIHDYTIDSAVRTDTYLNELKVSHLLVWSYDLDLCCELFSLW
jgi:hypothetical protein